MKTLPELKEEYSHVHRSAGDLFHEAEQSGRDLTPEEETRVKKLIDEGKGLKTQIEDRERQEALKAEISAVLTVPEPRVTLPVQPGGGTLGVPLAPPEPELRIVPKVEFTRYGKLNGFENTPDGHAKAHRCGMWLRSRVFGDEHAKRWCAEHGVGLRSQNELDPIYGGNLVPNEMAQTIIDLRDSYGIARQNATIMPMSRDIMAVPKIAGSLAATFPGEEGTLAEDEMSWINVNLVAQKAGTLIKVSSEVAEDAVVNLADLIATDMARAFALLEDQCLFLGDGTVAYGGMTGYEVALAEGAGLAGGPAGATGINEFSELTLTHLHVVMGLLPEFARPNAKWFMSALMWESVFSRLMAAAAGNTTITLAGQVMLSFLGSPVVLTPLLHTTGVQTDGSPLCLYGDMRMGTLIGDRRGFALKVSDQRFMDTDQIGITATTRFSIVNHGIGTAAAAGPMVALNANA